MGNTQGNGERLAESIMKGNYYKYRLQEEKARYLCSNLNSDSSTITQCADAKILAMTLKIMAFSDPITGDQIRVLHEKYS